MIHLWIVFCTLCLHLGNCSERNQIYVISDTHLGDTQHTTSETNEAVKTFLNNLTDPRIPIHTLVLNGDVVDLWTMPFDVLPPSPDEVYVSPKYNNVNMKEISDILNKILDNGVKILWIRGNHDDFTNQDYLDKAGLGRIKYYPFRYEGGNYEIHHGYEWTLNNMLRPSPPESKSVMKAWSYYVVRAKITHYYENPEEYERKDVKGPIHYIQELCKKLTGSEFDLKFLEDNAWWYEYDVDRQIGGGNPLDLKMYNSYKDRVIKGGDYDSYNSEDSTLAKAVEKFKDDIKLWVDTHGIEYVKNMLFADPCLDYDHWIQAAEKPVFLMGHTHLTDFKWVNNGTNLYVNSGCWLTNQDFYPVIRVTMNEGTDIANKVELCGFNVEDQTLDVKNSSSIPS